MSVLAVGALLLAAFPSAAGAARNWARTPGDVTAAEQAGGIEVSWSAPAEDAAAVTGYRVLRKAQGVDTRLAVVAEVTATSWVDIDATEPGQEYRYRIKAVRGDNVSKASRKATVVRSEKLAEPEPEPEPAEQLRNHTNNPPGACTAGATGITAALAATIYVNNGAGAVYTQHLHTSSYDCPERWYTFTISGAKSVDFTAIGLENIYPTMYLYADAAGTLLVKKSSEIQPRPATLGNYRTGIQAADLQEGTYWLKMRQEFSGHNIYDLSWTRRILPAVPDDSARDGGIWSNRAVAVDLFPAGSTGQLAHGSNRDDTDWFKVAGRPEVEEKFRMDEDDNFILDRYGKKIPVYVVLWVSLSSDTGAFFIVHDSDGNGGGVGQAVIGGNDRCVIVPFHNHKITGEMLVEVRGTSNSSDFNDYRLKVTTAQPTHCQRP
ncbi:fibronectin type III domain-containing protein [Candidatus Poriferisodalis sp.]|uniref:fibronectin type III domain-containing protein n=1 Tax=Candidatus Poriferisodalis sp. TaxID=3101277 RepID=UPI003B02A2C7